MRCSTQGCSIARITDDDLVKLLLIIALYHQIEYTILEWDAYLLFRSHSHILQDKVEERMDYERHRRAEAYSAMHPLRCCMYARP